jgi:hypothetical protein
MPKRPINYTSREFESIKNDLLNYAKRYYPNSFKDFNEASFGAMMLDMVSYVGDQLSFYVDYQANESFIDSALEYKNVVRLSKQLGFKMPGAAVATGYCTFYVLVPVATATTGPDRNYMPILKKGSLLTADNGNTYTLEEDVDFSNPNNETTVGRVDVDTGVPTFYAVRATGKVRSGQLRSKIVVVGDYLRFRTVPLGVKNVSEIMKVVDTQGNEYFEVEYLTEDVVISEVPNYGSTKETVPYIMKIQAVPRRFITQFDELGNVALQFGYGSEANLSKDLIVDPADVVLDTSGRNYISDKTFDPSNLIEGDKFGIVPVNTSLNIIYRSNTHGAINAPVNSITTIVSADFVFPSQLTLDITKVGGVRGSLEVGNENPILGDTTVVTAEELRTRAYSSFATQNRAVSRSDYVAFCYRMPANFGKIKRVNIEQDTDSLKRNLNLYVLAQGTAGNLVIANSVMKNNLKTWLNKYKMVNDSIDILDGRVINYGINFEVISDINANKYTILQRCVSKLQDKLAVVGEMGSPIHITEMYRFLNDVDGVVDTTNVQIVNKAGGVYSNFYYDMDSNTSDDGRFVEIPQNSVAEILLSASDIQGVVQ